jgi:L-threonylcarbamoyladenylate synthase
LPAKKNLPRQMLSQIVSKDGTISLRLPKSDFLIKIIRKVGAPLISTSLNLSGEKPLSNLNSLNKYFLPSNQPDLIIDIGELKKAKPSKIIDWRFNPPKVIRK